MFSVTRSYERHEVSIIDGAPAVLYTRHLAVHVRALNVSLGAAYARPSGVERAGKVYRVADAVMIVRLAALLVVLVVKVGRSVRR